VKHGEYHQTGVAASPHSAQNVDSATPEQMPAKGTSKVTERQKRILVAAKAGGIAIEKAAASAGVARSTAMKVLKDPGTREIFREIIASQDEALQGLMALVVKTLAEDLVSAQNDTNRARLRDEALKILAHARQLGNFGVTANAAGSDVSGGAMTLGDILVRVSTATTTTPAQAPASLNGTH
jgi:hypothetical protein